MSDILKYNRQGFYDLYSIIEEDVNAGEVVFETNEPSERPFYPFVQVRRAGVEQTGYGVIYSTTTKNLTVSNPSAVTAITDEAVGTGAVSKVTFSKTLLNLPVKGGTLVINVDGVDQVVTESAGTITGATLASGTLNKDTGALVLTFSTAPADGLTITADYDYYDTPTAVADEAVGTGNDILTNFMKTLTNIPVEEGTLVVKVDGTDQEVTESGGVVTGASLSAGTLNRVTGELDITFTTAPTDTLEITADYNYYADTVSITDEAIGTGTDAETEFSVTLAHTPIKEGTLVIEVDSVDKEVTEVNGIITGADLEGTLNKATGEMYLIFNTAPASGLAITADYDYFDNGFNVDDTIAVIGTFYNV